MKYVVALLFVLSGFGPSFAQSQSFNKFVQDDADSPANWCRNGQFSSLSKDYQLGQIKEKSRLIYDDDSKNAKACPSEDAKACPAKRTIDAKTSVAVSKKLRDFYCVYNPKNDTAGWVNEKNIAVTPVKNVQAADWIGTWSDGTNKIEIKKDKAGLRVVGHASWNGGNNNVHEGELDFVASPAKNRLTLLAKDEGDCAAEIINLGKYVIARDNGSCGGMNVNFNSVYRRK